MSSPQRKARCNAGNSEFERGVQRRFDAQVEAFEHPAAFGGNLKVTVSQLSGYLGIVGSGYLGSASCFHIRSTAGKLPSSR